jgi:hypothetical protein
VLFKAFLGGQPLPEAFWSGDHFITENTDSIVSRVGLLLEKAVLKYPRMKIASDCLFLWFVHAFGM